MQLLGAHFHQVGDLLLQWNISERAGDAAGYRPGGGRGLAQQRIVPVAPASTTTTRTRNRNRNRSR
jgi:hypothetical protein